MNLFWKIFFGRLEKTEKMEQAESQMLARYTRYTQISQSQELAEYKKLYQVIKSVVFKERKKTLQHRKFQDTEEYRKMKRFKRLDKKKKLKLYYELRKSEELKDFLAFKQTAEYRLLGTKKEVAKSERLKRYKQIDRSKHYKLYVRFHNSDIIKEYEALKVEIEREDFIQKYNFWANPKRWKTSDECKLEQAFFALEDSDNIQFYLNTDAKSFDDLKRLTLSFQDDFDGLELDITKWQNGFYHKPPLKRMYSFPNEKQAYSENNISVKNSELQIHTKAEKTKGAACWDPIKGFVQKDYKFTSGAVNAGDVFTQKTGLIRAKIAVKGSGGASHAFRMETEGKFPSINVFQVAENKISVGNYFPVKNSVSKEIRHIKGLNISKFYIYSLEWTAKELIWRINNIEVFRTSRAIPNIPLFPVFISFITENQMGGSGTLLVDWIRIYNIK